MKRLLIVFSFFLLASEAFTQNADEVAILQSLYGMGKRQVMIDYLIIPEESATKFWELYDKYEEKRKAIGKKRINNIEQYASNMELKDSQKAIAVARQSIVLSNEFTSLLEKTMKRFGGVIPPETIAKFVHIELFLDNLIKIQVAEKLTPDDSPIPPSHMQNNKL